MQSERIANQENPGKRITLALQGGGPARRLHLGCARPAAGRAGTRYRSHQRHQGRRHERRRAFRLELFAGEKSFLGFTVESPPFPSPNKSRLSPAPSATPTRRLRSVPSSLAR
jgi:hypothetical protein